MMTSAERDARHMPAQPDPDQLLTTTEVAELLRTTRGAVEHMRTKGTGPPFVKLGARVLYRRADLADFIAANTTHKTGNGK